MEKQYPLAPNGVFWTVQGEGALLGTPMVFIRLAGCSVGCPQCDTDYRVASRMTAAEIVTEVRRVLPSGIGFERPWVWVTGGEPTDHDLAPLVSALQCAGFRVALATSGVRAVQVGVDWLSVSPHSLHFAQQRGTELKVVPGLNGLSLAGEWLTETLLSSFTYRYVQPLHGQELSEAECLAFVQAHPEWRMGIQAHKVWGVA